MFQYLPVPSTWDANSATGLRQFISRRLTFMTDLRQSKYSVRQLNYASLSQLNLVFMTVPCANLAIPGNRDRLAPIHS